MREGLAIRQAGVRNGSPVECPATHCFDYRLIWSPALADIVGEGRPWVA
jgi:hypothetical protein